jgi:hypothetical protein
MPKKEGSLGIKRLAIWNQVSMHNHIWNFFSRSGSLWVAWIQENWLKGRSFWQVSIPQHCSWSWKKILQLRGIAKKFVKFEAGDGHNIFLWYDNWHPLGCLIDKFSYRPMYDAGHSIGPKLSSIIRRGSWFWPNARSEALVEIQSRLPEVLIGEVDQPIWGTKGGVFSCAETLEELREKKPVVEWHDVVWFSTAIPKHAFFLWFAFQDAITTREKLCSWGYTKDSLCLFCRFK